MQNTILNTDNSTFLITFKLQSTRGKFIFQKPIELKYILENYDKNGIDKILEFDQHKAKFTRVSKERILNFCNWETETILFLEKHYYFKK